MPKPRKPRGRHAVAPAATTRAVRPAVDARGYVLVFAVALGVRAVVAWSLGDLPLVRTPKLDSFEYLDWGRRIAGGDFRWPIPPPHGPGYPYFIGAVLSAGMPAATLPFVQSFIGALSCVLTARVASRFLPGAAALGAGLLLGVYGPLVLLDVSLFAEGLLVFLLVLALAVYREDLSGQRAFWLGVIVGVAALVRPTALMVLPVFAALQLWRHRAAPWKTLAAIAAGAVIVAAPVVLKNMSSGSGPLIQGHGGLNFYIGNSPSTSTGLAEHRLGATWDRLEGEAAGSGHESPASQDAYYFAKTFGEIRREPLWYGMLLLRKGLWLLQAEEIRDSHSFYFFRSQSLPLRLLPTWAVMFPLATCGAVVYGRRAPSVLYAYALAMALTCVLLVVGSRYRIPLAPVMCIFAAGGVWRAWEIITTREFGQAARVIAAAAIAVAISQVWRHAPSHQFAEEWAFTGLSLNTERNLPAAHEAYQRSIALDPESSFAWDGLGMVLQNQKQHDEARRAYERALALNPDSARSHAHLALLLELQGRPEEAIQHYQRTWSLRPDDLEAAGGVARMALQTGRVSEAVRALEGIMRLAPDSPQAQEAGRVLQRIRDQLP